MRPAPTWRYIDPLDQIWIATAQTIGLKVLRSPEVHASTNGAGSLFIGEPSSLDKDDCLAQMIFHELCHGMIEGEESFSLPDWGLDNTSPDQTHEHACLRLQAELADGVGLRLYLAPTTDSRPYYDALGPNPTAEMEPEIDGLVRRGLAMANGSVLGRNTRRALVATASILDIAADFPLAGSTDGRRI